MAYSHVYKVYDASDFHPCTTYPLTSPTISPIIHPQYPCSTCTNTTSVWEDLLPWTELTAIGIYDICISGKAISLDWNKKVSYCTEHLISLSAADETCNYWGAKLHCSVSIDLCSQTISQIFEKIGKIVRQHSTKVTNKSLKSTDQFLHYL